MDHIKKTQMPHSKSKEPDFAKSVFQSICEEINQIIKESEKIENVFKTPPISDHAPFLDALISYIKLAGKFENALEKIGILEKYGKIDNSENLLKILNIPIQRERFSKNLDSMKKFLAENLAENSEILEILKILEFEILEISEDVKKMREIQKVEFENLEKLIQNLLDSKNSENSKIEFFPPNREFSNFPTSSEDPKIDILKFYEAEDVEDYQNFQKSGKFQKSESLESLKSRKSTTSEFSESSETSENSEKPSRRLGGFGSKFNLANYGFYTK